MCPTAGPLAELSHGLFLSTSHARNDHYYHYKMARKEGQAKEKEVEEEEEETICGLRISCVYCLSLHR